MATPTPHDPNSDVYSLPGTDDVSTRIPISRRSDAPRAMKPKHDTTPIRQADLLPSVLI